MQYLLHTVHSNFFVCMFIRVSPSLFRLLENGAEYVINI